MRRLRKTVYRIYLAAWCVFLLTVWMGSNPGGISFGTPFDQFQYATPPAWYLWWGPKDSASGPQLCWRTLAAESPRSFTNEFTYPQFAFMECRRQVVDGWKTNGRTVRMVTVSYYLSSPFRDFSQGAAACTILVLAIPVFLSLGRKAVRYPKLRASRRAEALIARGICPKCGYDLRATPHRCPECGTVIPAIAAKSPTAPPSTPA